MANEIDKTKKASDQLKYKDLQINSMFAHYQIKKELGRGGMGIVYKAMDTKLKRIVALKLILRSGADSGESKRFFQEIMVMAQLEHPNIVRLFEMGESPVMYFTMEYIEGEDFSSFIKNKSTNYKKLSHIFLSAINGISEIHRNNILHRDIKPSNILVTPSGEAKIMDFGLAKCTNAETQLSQTGDILGTVAYISPEQAHGTSVDVRADIYSLGATLYEALTSRPPFQGQSHYNILYQVYSVDPVAPRRLKPDIPWELEAICLKCLEKSPAKRYSSAKQMAKDLRNFIENRPILAKSPSKVSFVLKWIQRNRLISFITTVSALSIMTLLFAFISQQEDKIRKEQQINLITKRNLEKEKKAKEKEKKAKEKIELAHAEIAKQQKIALEKNSQLRQALYRSKIRLAQQYEKSSPKKVKLFLASCPPDLRNWEWGWIYHKASDEISNWPLIQGNQRDQPRYATFHPDGKRLACCYSQHFVLWNLRTGEEEFRLRCETTLEYCAFHPNGRFFLVSGWNGFLALYDLVEKREIRRYQGHKNKVKSCTFSPDGKIFLSQENKGMILWDFITGKKLLAIPSRSDINRVAFSPDGNLIAIAQDNTMLSIFNSQTGERRKVLAGHAGTVTSCVFSPRGDLLLSSSEDLSLRLWEVKTGKEIRAFEGHTDYVTGCDFSPDGKTIISSSFDGFIKKWDTHTGKELWSWRGHEHKVASCQFSPSGKLLVSVSVKNRGSIKVWSNQLPEKPLVLQGHHRKITSCAIDPQNKRIVSGSYDTTAKTWDLKNGQVENTLFGHRFTAVSSCAFSPDGQTIATGGYDFTLRLWDSETGKQKAILEEHQGKVTSCVFSPDGKKMASTSEDKTFKIWDVEKRKCLVTHRDEKRFSCAFSPDGKTLIVTQRNLFEIWDVEFKVARRQVITDQKDVINYCTFSPDGKIFATCGSDHTIRLWTSKNGKPVATLKGHSDHVYFCSFSPNGKRLVSGGRDKTLLIWDMESKQLILELGGHKGSISACFFTLDGRKIISASEDRTIRIWSSADWKN